MLCRSTVRFKCQSKSKVLKYDIVKGSHAADKAINS